MRKVDN